MVLSICSKIYGMLYKGWVSMKWRDDGRDALRNNTLNSFNDFLCILFRRKVLTQRQWQIRGHEDRKTLSDFLPELEQFGYKDILNMVPSSMALVCTERLLYCIWSSLWVRVPLGCDYLVGPSDPIRRSLLTYGHWWDLHGLITSPPGCLGGLSG
ncbi:hypothetical protein YC2023_067093 [Brassica napus]